VKKYIYSLSIAFLVIFQANSTIVPNPIISRGKVAYTSNGKVSYLTDNKFGTTSLSISKGSWIALKLDSGYSKIFVNWNNPNYSWSDTVSDVHSCNEKVLCPVNYIVQTSSNSTNGSDGTWVTKDSIVGNVVTARGHLIDFKGASWVKMSILVGGGNIDEFEVFDVADSISVAQDSWFFPGTSISANAFKSTPPSPDFADNISKLYSCYNPIMIRGGIPCILSIDMATDISKYLKMAGNVKYWAIEMGTNDAWGGGNGNVTSFTKNMQKIIDSCKAKGIRPIIARLKGNDSAEAKWQVHPDFLKAIDTLTAHNHLIPGPDFYTWFVNHPTQLNSDGVHPNADGAASMQLLWAQTMASLYIISNNSTISTKVLINSIVSSSDSSAALTSGDTLDLNAQAFGNGSWLWKGPAGFTSVDSEIKIENIQTNQAGNYIVSYFNGDTCGTKTIKVTVNAKVFIQSILKNNDINIYPNPSIGGNFNIELKNYTIPTEIKIFDVQGKLKYNSILINKVNKINISLNSGVYIVKLMNRSLNFFEKFIVQ
jgi:lysophospholipase L1-like esterase